MTPTWKQYEGQAVDGIALLQLLGSGETSAVFLGDRAGERCAVKLVPAEGHAPPVHLAGWEQASKLSHPHLSRILQWGAGRLGNTSLVYVAMEFAEDDLSSVDRPLTPKEARETLTPVVDALAYLHGKGFVHGRIKPSNVLSVGDRLKISGDAPVRKGDAAGDVYSLGLVLVEALTKELPVVEGGSVRLPDSLKPDSFREVAAGCLEPEPALRWTVYDLSQWLERGAVPAPKRVRPKYLVPAAAAAGLLAVGTLIWAYVFPYFSASEPTGQASSVPAALHPDGNVPSATAAPVKAPPLPKREFTPAPEDTAVEETKAQTPPAKAEVKPVETHPEVRDALSFPDVAQSVLPEVPAKSMATVHGKVPITVRVQADASGTVTNATVESGKSSQYFADLALKAAQQWKFVPGSDGRVWILRFEFTRTAQHPVAAQVTPSR